MDKEFGGFKVGDFVKAVKDFEEVKIGMVGRVVHLVGGSPPIGVEWETLTTGHTCEERAKKGHGYYVFAKDIEHLYQGGQTMNYEEAIKAVESSKTLCAEGKEDVKRIIGALCGKEKQLLWDVQLKDIMPALQEIVVKDSRWKVILENRKGRNWIDICSGDFAPEVFAKHGFEFKKVQ